MLTTARLPDMFVGNDLSPACSVIQSYLTGTSTVSPVIALHASSNGGGNNAAMLATLLTAQGSPAPFSSTILDCTPGKPEYKSASRAIRLSIPQTFGLRKVSILFIYFFLFLYKIYCEGLGKQNRILWVRDTLNDEVAMGVGVRRLYVYSKADPLVEASHIHEHAEDMRKKATGEVREEVFETAPHCALLNEDAERYWKAVEEHVMGLGEETRSTWWPAGKSGTP